MRRHTLVVTLAMAILASTAVADLQNVEVGGQIRIRGNWYTGEIWSWDGDNGNTFAFVEQRTRLHLKADFTDKVNACIELDSYDTWGEDVRSNWLTGVDGRAASVDDVEMYQAYVEAEEMWGYPLRLRAGRQELAFGSQWLLGVNDAASLFMGLSFDAIRLTATPGDFRIDAIWAKLAENSPLEEDGDADLYVLYGSYSGIERITLDAYWMYVRDARAVPQDTVGNDLGGWAQGVMEDWLGLDEWGPTELYTVGIRGSGKLLNDALDFEAELAYQFGDAGQVGRQFRYWYSDNDASYGSWGANIETGYTFGVKWHPRVYAGFVWLDGEDNRTPDGFREWTYSLLCPVSRPNASLGFNRLFSNWEYTEFIENTDLSNARILRGGVSAAPSEKLKVLLALSYYETVDELKRQRWVRLPWNLEPLDGMLGWEVGLYLTYAYSEDVTFDAGYAHLFTGDALVDGNFVINNALNNYPGTDDDDPDHVFVQTTIAF